MLDQTGGLCWGPVRAPGCYDCGTHVEAASLLVLGAVLQGELGWSGCAPRRTPYFDLSQALGELFGSNRSASGDYPYGAPSHRHWDPYTGIHREHLDFLPRSSPARRPFRPPDGGRPAEIRPRRLEPPLLQPQPEPAPRPRPERNVRPEMAPQPPRADRFSRGRRRPALFEDQDWQSLSRRRSLSPLEHDSSLSYVLAHVYRDLPGSTDGIRVAGLESYGRREPRAGDRLQVPLNGEWVDIRELTADEAAELNRRAQLVRAG